MKYLRKFNESIDDNIINMIRGYDLNNDVNNNLQKVAKRYSTKECIDVLENIFNGRDENDIFKIWAYSLECGRFDIVDELIRRGFRIEDSNIERIKEWLNNSKLYGRIKKNPDIYERALKYLN